MKLRANKILKLKVDRSTMIIIYINQFLILTKTIQMYNMFILVNNCMKENTMSEFCVVK